jgi:SAM-dependent methyltransferase
MQQRYTLDNSWAQARERLGLLEAALNPGSIRHLERLGVAEGWHCADVGAGGGSIAEWLCQKVGASGYVLATDIDTRFLDALAYPNLEVRHHDITTEDLPEASFDLVHTRLVLIHLADRERALARLVFAVKPGGWLLVEESDSVSLVPDPRCQSADLFAKILGVIGQVINRGAANGPYGRRVLRDVYGTGLVDIDSEGHVLMTRGGTARARFWQLTAEQLRDRLVGTGSITEAEMDNFLALLDDEDFFWLNAIIMAVWGRKPS